MFTQNELKKIAEKCAEKVQCAERDMQYFNDPFRHIVIDNFFPDALANACLEYFPQLDDPVWEYSNDADIEVKFRSTWKSEFDMPEGIVDAVRILNSSLLLKAIGEKIGISKIIPDPYFTGGGLNATATGGLLDVHIDGNYHDSTGLN